MHQRISKNKHKSKEALCLSQVMSTLDLSSHWIFLCPPNSGKHCNKEHLSMDKQMKEQFAHNSWGGKRDIH